ncbi:hypothetical protein GGS21DRAFT_20894 [Xylaria nigripes]|nr:hypothetical protein GGS21DRAFT_20894 [Xylaria nigripes]
MDPTGPTDTQTVKQDNDTPSSRPADASQTPVKRGRGRPPKNGIAPQPKKVPTGRPRGRPPGSGAGVKKATVKKPAATSSTGTGRRGRPPKVKNATTASGEATSTTKKTKTSAETSTSVNSKNAEGSASTERESLKKDTPEEPDAENEDADAEADGNADADYSMDDGGGAESPLNQGLNYGLEVALLCPPHSSQTQPQTSPVRRDGTTCEHPFFPLPC